MNVADIFETMDYGSAPEDATAALEWIATRGPSFGHFINGAFTAVGSTFDSLNPATGDVICSHTQATQSDVDDAVSAAKQAQPKWERMGGAKRARYLYAVARLLQKHSRLFAVLEVLDNGKPIREARDIDVPLAQRHFYYHAGMAQLMATELPQDQAIGVCGQIIPWNFPLLMLSWKIAPALAMGNAVVLKSAEYTSLTALLFAQICQEAGLPKGVVNIVTGDGTVGEMIVRSDVDKIAFTGSTSVGRRIRAATAGSGKALTLELGGKSPYIVFDDADLDSAVEGLVDAIWFNQGQVCCAGSRLLVHEPIADRLYQKIRTRMQKLRVGDPLDKAVDIGALVHPVQLSRVKHMIDSNSAGQTFVHEAALPAQGCYYPPTLITGLSPSDTLMQEEIFGPVLVSTTFRTPAEAVALANNSRYGLAASIWSENINLSLDIAPKLASGIVWVNGTNMMDAAAGFGGIRESGFGREGGWEGLAAYTKPNKRAQALTVPSAFRGDGPPIDPIDRTAKLYIGGKQTRPDGGYSKPVWGENGALLGHVSEANRKDVRNAVEAAAAATAWSKTNGHQRAQILYYIAENLSAQSEAFADRLNRLQGVRTGQREVECTVDRLFTYAAWADKYDGHVHDVPIRGVALAMKEPIGTIGVICPPNVPLLGLVSCMAPALAMGNRVVLIASEPFPLAATDFYHILEASDVPPGAVNILTGDQSVLAGSLAGHLNVDAVWCFAARDLSTVVEFESQNNLKRTWVNYGADRDWFGSEGEGHAFLKAATEIKNIWIPYGE
ncbi:MAG: aldehyde dehydrogenase family protein [Pseudomonadota bacterium]